MRKSTLKWGAVAVGVAIAFGVASPSWAGSSVSAVQKRSPNVAGVQQVHQQAGTSVEFSSAERTPTTTGKGAKWK